MSTHPPSVPIDASIAPLSIEEMTPSTRHFVSLKCIYNGIKKRSPSLTARQFRGWHSRRILSDAGAVFHGRMNKNSDNFLEMCFLRGKSSTIFGCYELKLAKTMEAYLSAEENVGAIRTMILRYIAPHFQGRCTGTGPRGVEAT